MHRARPARLAHKPCPTIDQQHQVWYNTGMTKATNMTWPNSRPSDKVFPEAQRPGAIAEGRCVQPPFGCGKPVKGFDDALSRAEFRISGLCQRCQDEVFG